MWGRDVGALVVVDMVFDEICVRGKKGDEGQFIALIPCKLK